MTRGASEIHEDTPLSSCGPATAIKKKRKNIVGVWIPSVVPDEQVGHSWNKL